MSTSREITYTCPYCDKEFAITIWDSVNGDQDEDLRELCASGSIFTHSCPHCRKDFMIQNPLLYTDAVHKFALVLSKNDVHEYFASIADPLAKKGWHLRRCATVREFTEKIAIFEDGQDDILVELAKYDSFIEYIDSHKGKTKDVTSVEYQTTEEDVMRINVRANDQGMTFHIPVNQLEEELKVEEDLFRVDETTFPCINSDWIISLYTQPSGEA